MLLFASRSFGLNTFQTLVCFQTGTFHNVIESIALTDCMDIIALKIEKFYVTCNWRVRKYHNTHRDPLSTHYFEIPVT